MESPTPMMFKFEPIPLFHRRSIVDAMPDGYCRHVDPHHQPTIVDPREVARLIGIGKQVMATQGLHGATIYLTSDRPASPYLGIEDRYPACFEEEQPWSKAVPWETLGKMTVKRAAGFLVFVDPSFDQPQITTTRYQVIPQLSAFVIRGSASL